MHAAPHGAQECFDHPEGLVRHQSALEDGRSNELDHGSPQVPGLWARKPRSPNRPAPVGDGWPATHETRDGTGVVGGCSRHRPETEELVRARSSTMQPRGNEASPQPRSRRSTANTQGGSSPLRQRACRYATKDMTCIEVAQTRRPGQGAGRVAGTSDHGPTSDVPPSSRSFYSHTPQAWPAGSRHFRGQRVLRTVEQQRERQWRMCTRPLVPFPPATPRSRLRQRKQMADGRWQMA